jgi:hypothetical protein
VKTFFWWNLSERQEKPAYHVAKIVSGIKPLPNSQIMAGVKTKKAHPVSQDELDIMR